MRLSVILVVLNFLSSQAFAQLFPSGQWINTESNVSVAWRPVLVPNDDGNPTTSSKYLLLQAKMDGKLSEKMLTAWQPDFPLSNKPIQFIPGGNQSVWIISHKAPGVIMAVLLSLPDFEKLNYFTGKPLSVSPDAKHVARCVEYSSNVCALFVDNTCVFPLVKSGFKHNSDRLVETGQLPYQLILADDFNTSKTSLLSPLMWKSPREIECVLAQDLEGDARRSFSDEFMDAYSSLNAAEETGKFRYLKYSVAWSDDKDVATEKMISVNTTVLKSSEAKSLLDKMIKEYFSRE